MIRRALVLALLVSAAPVAAAEPEPPPERIVSAVVYGNDPCPRSSGDEIIVCARQPESERYRIPKRFRDKRDQRTEQSWASTAQVLEYVGRAGTPNSCSPVGSGGQTGCYRQFLRQAREERARMKAEAEAIP